MHEVVAALALVVAGMYVYIAVGVVPRLGRGEGSQSAVTRAARVAAVLFFAGCALTHTGIAVELLATRSADGHAGPGAGSTPVLVLQHVLPHVVQIVGGAVFIGITRRRLEVSVLPKDAARRLRDLELRFRSAFEHGSVGMALVSFPDGRPGELFDVNRAFCELVGHRREELRGTTYLDLVVPADRPAAVAAREALLAGAEGASVEQRLIHRDGHLVLTSSTAVLVRPDDGTLPFVVAQIRDITDERRRQGELQHLADHDGLTAVFNRRRFEEELDRMVERTLRDHEPAALLVIDLDQFKYVNDTYGHGVGDQLLGSVAASMRGRLRGTDVIGRLGGDEFGVLCPRTSSETARTLALSLLQSIRDEAHVDVGSRAVRSAASVGITVIDGIEAVTSKQLLAEADIAMYDAKESGHERVSLIQPGNAGLARMREQLAWAEHIREALAEGAFQLWEQPILNLLTGVCDRSELLVRMIRPADGQLVLPTEFLPVAERFGQIQAIDRWVFRQAIRLSAIRHAAGDRRVLEINLSGGSLTDEPLIDDLEDLIAGAPVDPTRLMVEITETSAIGNFEVARAFAARLGDLGCRFALDDFGSGFGSFYYLKHLPFDGLKIDGEFIRDLPNSATDRLTVAAIAALAHGLGKETTAEFVQDEATLDLLRGFGIGHAQGRFVGVPQPVRELTNG